MIETVVVNITNEWELFDHITNNIREGFSASQVLQDIKDELYSIDDLEDRSVFYTTISGAVFGKDEVVVTVIVEGWIMEGGTQVIDVEVNLSI